MPRRAIFVLAVLALCACEKQLTPTEKAAKDRGECMVIATDQSGFDPITAEEPPRTISSSHERGGDLKEGAIDVGKGAAGGAVPASWAAPSWAKPGRGRPPAPRWAA